MITPNFGQDTLRETAQVTLIYEDYKIMVLNKKYYGRRLEEFKRTNLIIEFLIAAGATGSGVAGFAVWQQNYGAAVWGVLSALSIVLAIAKPLLKLSDRIEVYSKLYGEYASAVQNLKTLIDNLQVERQVSEERRKNFIQIRNRTAELARLNDPRPNRRLTRALTREVDTEISITRLWLPIAKADGYADVVGVLSVQKS